MGNADKRLAVQLTVPAIESAHPPFWARWRLFGRNGNDHPHRNITEPVLRGRKAAYFFILTGLWAAVSLNFWLWWIVEVNAVNVTLYLLISLSFFFQTSFPQYWFVSAVGRMRRMKEDLAPPPGKKVFMATAFVPGSERVGVLEQTLKGMIDQEYPHDVWLTDEGFIRSEAEAVRKLIQRLDNELSDRYSVERTEAVPRYDADDAPHYSDSYRDLGRKPINVRYFSRHNVAAYQLDHPPFRRRTKCGNYNALLDFMLNTLGLKYDIMCQLDTDHIPQQNYLNKILAGFQSDEVAYVAAPSINSRCLYENWSSTGRYHMEAPFHGMMQLGFSDDCFPLIMGSHVAYDLRKFLEKKGGFQESRSEDILHTLTFATMDTQHGGGYKGVFAQDAAAIGYGLDSFADSIKQEVSWSQAVARIFFEHFIFRASKLLDWRRKYLFSVFLLYYVISALPYLILSLLPAVMLTFNLYGPDAGAGEFLWRYGLMLLGTMPFWYFARAFGLLRPADAKPRLWYFMLIELTRWPWYMIGSITGTIHSVTKTVTEFGITKKGLKRPEGEHYSIRFFLPHIGIVLINWCGLAVYYFLYKDAGPFNGIVYWALATCIIYGAVFLGVTANNTQRMLKQGVTWTNVMRWRWSVSAVALALNIGNGVLILFLLSQV